MDADKLNEAAEEAATIQYRNLSDPDVSQDGRTEAMFASMFEQGAEWALSLPLADRMTDEEKEKIRGMWHDLMELYLNRKSSKLSDFVSMFKELFGVELTDDVIKAYQENLEHELHPSTIEIWRDIPEYEDLYQVSNLGRIKHKATKAIGGSGYCDKDEYFIHPTKNKKGYIQVGLSKDDVYRMYLVHRLVALAFIPNPKGCKCVNHKNCIKDDNRVENLEWCTHSYNTRHAFAKGRMAKSPSSGQPCHKVKAIRLSDGEEFVFDTMFAASQFIGVDRSAIRYHLLKGKSVCKGYRIIDGEQEDMGSIYNQNEK